ncbi:methylcobamide--CoM methyltransferase [Clostridium senegalense]|uniref:uroporphyrinogen decarboxylase family protein n=1 Tax=Clostridium senegalense TaxID=1465809 RepID=UPI001C113A32|nr:uroporphyrinogen decarboxylase family protein [Clostridium senegalense]MBU5225182.1 methylcobamide--CoM methyltransferase [Clostridium senegalense]
MFKCVSDNIESIPKTICDCYPDFYTRINTNEFMSKISKEIKEIRNDVFCKVPFCNTIEAEAFGGIIKLADENTSSRVGEYLINSVEDLEKIRPINFSKGRIKEVLDSVKNLSEDKENVVLMVEGPMTIVTSLMDSRLFYKLYRKNKDAIEKLLNLIEEGIVEYIREAIKNGVKVISYADPVGNIDIIGPKYFKELTGTMTCNIIRSVKDILISNNVLFHICGRTSTSLEECDFVNKKCIHGNEELTYGENLINLSLNKENDKLIVVGHWCIKRTFLNKSDNIITLLELK